MLPQVGLISQTGLGSEGVLETLFESPKTFRGAKEPINRIPANNARIRPSGRRNPEPLNCLNQLIFFITVSFQKWVKLTWGAAPGPYDMTSLTLHRSARGEVIAAPRP